MFGIVKCKSDIVFVVELLMLILDKFDIVSDFVVIDLLKLQLLSKKCKFVPSPLLLKTICEKIEQFTFRLS